MEERLQKLIAAAGLASRRHAEQMITAGEVSVNGQVVTELGTRADPAKDHIKVRGRLINTLLETHEKIYILLYKPRGYLTSLSDTEGRPVVIDLLPPNLGRVHPVGRLDFNTEGLLILTNDGELTNFITSARNQVAKVYEVKVKGVPPVDAIARLRRGITIDGERTASSEITLRGTTETNAWYEVILHEGRNQQIRKMFDAIGHSVLKLRRIAIGPLRDERLAPGQWRPLETREVKEILRSGEKSKGQKSAAKSPRRTGAAQKPQQKTNTRAATSRQSAKVSYNKQK